MSPLMKRGNLLVQWGNMLRVYTHDHGVFQFP